MRGRRAMARPLRDVFSGVDFRKIPSRARVLVEGPKTCQYYFLIKLKK
jgi:hypothetical protein